MGKQKNFLILVLVIVVSITALFFVYPVSPVANFATNFRPWKLGLDLVGGSYLIYEADMSQVAEADRESVMAGLRDVIEKRVNYLGVSEPHVFSAKEGESYRLVAELAGVKDVNQAIMIIGLTPTLDFREVTGDGTKAEDYKTTSLTGRYIKSASLNFDQTTSEPLVALEFNSEGAKIFEEITGRNVGKSLAVFLDGVPIEVATVQEKISGGKAQITGRFTMDVAKTLVERFNAGALPAPITLINQQTISPTLGADSLNKAILAGLAGTLSIMVFMVLYYGYFGIFSSLALLIYILLSAAFFKIVPVTMTLAGVAGYVLSIGMAIDASILIFERTREELKKGLTRKAAIEEGFKRAWTSIRDSNVSTIITAVILYYFTSSFVKGFALTLLIGVLISMFSAITVTRTMLMVFVKNKNNLTACLPVDRGKS
ncbi:MAG: protein-export membrane protein SecD [Candidatus Liptonbacteria bacterium RIFOXYC1_FULL_36_8]|uniref:Protein translocase subunit SecD n=1 Tax=Candidatus Liptonbacteria bacterium RIFOXYC1_FULL_36_8 TaxID=1798655 RepID=A0A1G2CQG8_9BACT|nr:MAG: protein-export membrane protein SecD [Candidatus Liptonbacteria bacterium RIFOXYC1_FULL_36_8]